jgi:hypothetical protein
MPRNYILGGDNLVLPDRRDRPAETGGVFIRRSFRDDEVYKLVLRRPCDTSLPQAPISNGTWAAGRERAAPAPQVRSPGYLVER